MKWWKRALIVGAAFLLVLVAAVVVHWQYYEYLTRVELDRIRAAGEPLTFEELLEYCRVEAEDYRHESDWQAAIAELRRVREESEHGGIAELFIGDPSPDLEEAVTTLQQFNSVLSLTRKAAASPGPIRCWTGKTPTIERYDEAGLELHDDLDELTNLFLVSSSMSVRAGDTHSAVRDLLVLLSLGRCLEFDVSSIRELGFTAIEQRMSCDREALWQAMMALSAIELSESELSDLQAAIEAIHYEEHHRVWLLSERVRGLAELEAFTQGQSYGVTVDQSGNGLIVCWTPQSRFIFLSKMRQLTEICRMDWPQMETALDGVYDSSSEGFSLPMTQRHFMRLEDKIDLPSLVSGVLHEWISEHQAALTVVAIERYRRRNHRLPETLDALTPEFLDAVPRDPFGGRPLRYRVEQDAYCVYSIHFNRKDDGGSEKALRDVMDVGYRIPLKERP